MPSIDVTGAAARLLANKTLTAPGLCLHYCWLAISQGRVHYITGGADTAYDTWLAVPAAHQHASRNVPKDMPAFLGPKPGSSAGDEIISSGTRNSAGELLFAATDWPRAKQVGLCTLAEREAQTGREFVGWASSQGGYTLTTTSTVGESGTPIITEQETDEMRVYQISDGGLQGTMWGLSPGAMCCAKDSTDGLFLAAELNPTGQPIARTEAQVRTLAGYLGIPNNLITAGMAGVNWSWAKDVANTKTTAGGAVDLGPVLEAIKNIPAPPTEFVAK